MTAKPMTQRELDFCKSVLDDAMLTITFGRKTLEFPIEMFASLIATARLAPVWHNGTEPPEHDQRVLAYWGQTPGTVQYGSYDDEGPSVWFDDGGECGVPDYWCDFATPPNDNEQGAAAPTQNGGGE